MGKTIQFTQEQKQCILQEYKNGKSLTNIGKIFGISYRPIKRILEENNVHIRTASENKRENLLGQIFGKLTVIQLDPNYIPESGRHAKWLCQCECGNIVSVQSNHLKSGAQSACSPACKHQIPVGSRIGALIIIEPTHARAKNGGAVIYKCQCDCGEICYVSSTELRAKRKTSCDKCKESYGETKIRLLLEEHQIPYEKEKTFENCINPETNKRYRFDFFINNEYIVEFDGEQHFKPIEYFGGQEYFETCQARDKRKNEYCKQNNIPIIRIPYTHLEDLSFKDIKPETSHFLLI